MRLNGMNIARRRNPVAPPPGDLTVRLKDGREVNTTPEFVDANGGLFTYDDYIKGSLLSRMPKDDSIPFYAFSQNQKANALYEARGNWAKSHSRHTGTQGLGAEFSTGGMAGGSNRGTLKYVLYSNKQPLRSADLLRALTTPVWPSRSDFDASQSVDVSKEHYAKLAAAYPVMVPWVDMNSDYLWAEWGKFGTRDEFWALLHAIKLVLGEGHALSPRDIFDLPLDTFVAIRKKWEEVLATPSLMAAAHARMADYDRRVEEDRVKREAYWASRPASASAASSSSGSSSDTPAPASTYSAPSQEISGMQYAQAMMLHDAMFGKKHNPRVRLNGMNVARKPSSRQVQERMALRPHLHEQMEEREEYIREKERQARLERQRAFVRNTTALVNRLVSKYSGMPKAKWNRWNVIDDLLADPAVERNIAIYIEDPLTVYIVEASLPTSMQRHPLHTAYLRDQALQHISDSAGTMP